MTSQVQAEVVHPQPFIINNRPIPRPLTKEQSDILEAVANTDRSIQQYLRENPISPWQIIKSNPQQVILYSAGGSLAGFATAQGIVKLSETVFCTLPLPPHIIVAGKIIFIVIGTFLGGAYKTISLRRDELRTIHLSDRFAQWRSAAIKTKVYPIFQDFIRDHEQLIDFLCPITQELIIFPVITPDKKIFEKESIEKHIDQCTERRIFDERTHPFRARRLTKHHLKYCPEYHDNVVKKLQKVLSEELVDAVRDGLITYRDSVSINNHMAVNQIHKVLMKRQKRGEISLEELNEATIQIFSNIQRL